MPQIVRITPYNVEAGAVARRISIGGRLYIAGREYTVSDSLGAKLLAMKQPTGAPLFELLGGQGQPPAEPPPAASPPPAPPEPSLWDEDEEAAPESGEVESEPVDLDSMTKAELKALADDLGVYYPSSATAARIREILREHV